MQVNKWHGLAAILTIALSGSTAHAQEFIGLTSANQIFTFTTASLGNLQTPIPITGLGGANVLGIDLRPSTGLIYGLTSANSVVTINRFTGVITSTTPIAGLSLTGANFGVDFNPTNTLLRVVTNTGRSLAINVDAGTFTEQPAINGATTGATGAAYTNNDNDPTTGTTLFVINESTDTLYTQVAGTSLTTAVGTGLGINIGTESGFEIDSFTTANTGFLAASNATNTSSSFYTVNLATGSASTSLGTFNFGAGTTLVRGIAVAVPEAGTGVLSLLAVGGVGLVGLVRRKKK